MYIVFLPGLLPFTFFKCSLIPSTEVVEPTEVPAASSPKTSDKLPVPIIAGVALLSVVAVFISRKKMSA